MAHRMLQAQQRVFRYQSFHINIICIILVLHTYTHNIIGTHMQIEQDFSEFVAV